MVKWTNITNHKKGRGNGKRPATFNGLDIQRPSGRFPFPEYERRRRSTKKEKKARRKEEIKIGKKNYVERRRKTIPRKAPYRQTFLSPLSRPLPSTVHFPGGNVLDVFLGHSLDFGERIARFANRRSPFLLSSSAGVFCGRYTGFVLTSSGGGLAFFFFRFRFHFLILFSRIGRLNVIPVRTV